MRKKNYILLRIIFLLALLVNCGLTAYTSGGLNINNIELTPNENSVEPGLCSDNLLVFDGPADQFYTFRLADLPESKSVVTADCSVIRNFCISVWHPPENS